MSDQSGRPDRDIATAVTVSDGVPVAREIGDRVVVALDVGGSSIKAGLVDRNGVVVLERRRPTGVAAGPDAVVDGIADLAQELVQAAPSGVTVAGVGIGVPGVVDSAAGIGRYAANLGWRDVPFVRRLTDRTGLPAALGHDVRNGALAEARLGAGRGAASVYFIGIGTGIAGGQVTDGRVDDGSTGQAGEIGHLVVRPGGPPCNCGNRGCLEAIASASRIASAYRERSGHEVTAERVSQLAQAGDAVAQQVWTEAVLALADALVAQTVLTDPGMIVVGGGLSLAGEVLLGPLRPAMAERFTFRQPPPVQVTTLGDRAGLIGAAIRAWDLLDAGT